MTNLILTLLAVGLTVATAVTALPRAFDAYQGATSKVQAFDAEAKAQMDRVQALLGR